MTENKKSLASMKYDRTNTKWLNLKLNVNTDNDIIEYISALSNKQGYIKKLIREDMKRSK